MNDNAYLQMRVPLPAGTEIIAENGIRYTIQSGTVGGGGSSLVYRVLRTNSARLFVLKECYPASDEYHFVRKNGVVCAKEESDYEAAQYLQQMKDDMARENEIAQRIANVSGRVITPTENVNAVEIILDGKSYSAAGSFFIVMEQMAPKNFGGESDYAEDKGWFLKDLLKECALPRDKSSPLRNGGLPAPNVVARVMVELLKSLRDVHNAGFVHGDIQDENFFMFGHDLSTGDIGIGTLLDFGNARALTEDGQTAPIADRRIFSTPGFCSPEIRFENDGTLRLTPATDIFSAGCLMLYLIKGMNYRQIWGEELSSAFSITSPVSDRELLRRGFLKKPAALAKKILSRALAPEAELRYRNANAMLNDILKLEKLTAPLRFPLSPNLSYDFQWVEGSRSRELADLQKKFNESAAPLYIWGIGGIGKTTLALKFAGTQISRGISAYLVKFRGTIKETVLDMNFANYEFSASGGGNAQDKEYRERLNILKTDYAGSLLIIDNFEREDTDLAELQREEAYRDIVNSGVRILFTTRSRPDLTTPELNPFDEKSAFALFKNIVCGSENDSRKFTPDEEKIIGKLLREIEYHPLTIELAARAVSESWDIITPEFLLHKFKSGTLQKGDRTAKIYEQIRILLRLFKLDDSYRDIFCHMTLLPVDGFDASIWLNSEEPVKKKQLKTIEAHGWIRRRRENNRLYIHSLIRSVVKNEFKPSEENCDSFLSCLWKNFEDRYPPDAPLFRQAAELYEKAAEDLQDSRGDYATHAAYSYIIAGNNARAFLNENRAIRIRAAASHPDLARNYNDAGVIHMKLLDKQQALEYLTKAQKILEAQDSPDPDLANVYSNLSCVYLELEAYAEALKYSRAAVEIFKFHPPKNKFELANAFNSLGTVLVSQKMYDEAIEYLSAAVKILEEISPETDSRLAFAYLKLGDAYGAAGKFDMALKFAHRALKIHELTSHSDIVETWGLLSEIYRILGQEAKSFFYAEKVNAVFMNRNESVHKQLVRLILDNIEVQKNLLASNLETPAGISNNYRKIAESFCKLCYYENARKYIDIAIEMIESEENFSEVKFRNYIAAADIYGDLREFDTAIKYAHRAFAEAQSIPENLSLSCTKLGDLYRRKRKNKDALIYYEKVLRLEQARKYPDYEFIYSIKSRIGNIFRDLQLYREADKIYNEIRAYRASTRPDFHTDVQIMDEVISEVRSRMNESKLPD